jgi:hypothetical protein
VIENEPLSAWTTVAVVCGRPVKSIEAIALEVLE